jgi:hypothetical protein
MKAGQLIKNIKKIKESLLVIIICLIMSVCVNGQIQQQNPSVIPLPQSVRWGNVSFNLSTYSSVSVDDTSLLKLAGVLQNMITESVKETGFNSGSKDKSHPIELKLAKIESPLYPNEAYQIKVSKNKITLTANTVHGIFNGLQTFRQLIQNGKIAACEISDWPAFTWRGYMVDVGRNYQSVELLKQQIDIMSRYKLTIFHFHPTEDIAWRIAIKRYPQLTDPETMIRDKGKFYSEKDIKELIQYCRDRFITFVPEIDMPGHSAAFKRALGVDMQSDKGIEIIKNILTELNQTYHLPYFHIGADEVKFTNKNFLPEITDFLNQQGKQTIGWHPGGNYDVSTIRQLWMSKGMENQDARYIDSRSLYINHMDPLESVVSIFQRKLCDTSHGGKQNLGGEICLWNDRRVATENDLLRMNPVYPSILAFAERSWRGGGFPNEVVDIGKVGSARQVAFEEFENRLIEHKHLYFKNLPFSYVRQGNIEWKFFGPFENKGNLDKRFWPENKNVSIDDSVVAAKELGGTVYIRHWWFPQLKSWLKDPEENTTWYAYRKIWKDRDTTGFMWIGFNNLSRSPATDSPDKGTWDNRQSSIWLNGNIIEPPQWKNAGATGNSELPLSDEGYEYRAPTLVQYKKGWNTILIKLPVKSFSGKDWQNPVKWMFTAVAVHKGDGINWDAGENEK